MNGRLRAGVVGCGGIARAHLAAYQADGEVDIVAAYDAHRPAAEAFALMCGAAVSNSPREMAEQFQLDVVSICSPPTTHLANSTPFVEAGVAVLCEKPLEGGVAAASALAALVKRHGTLFMPAFCHRFHPAIIELKKLVDSGRLGRPILFRNIFGGYVPVAGNHRADPALSGGGALLDNGCHSIDLYRFLMGEPSDVQAIAAHVLQDIPVEDFGMFHLTASGARLGQIISSYSLKGSASTLEWYGSAGCATVNYFSPDHPDLSYRVEGSGEPVVVDCAALPDRFTAEVAHILACVRDGQPIALTVELVLRANHMVAAFYASARSGALTAVDYSGIA